VLHACFVNRPEERRGLRQTFRLYWRDPRYMEHMMALMLPAMRGVQEEHRAAEAAEKRAAEALLDGPRPPAPETPESEEETEIEIDATPPPRPRSAAQLDFEQMTHAEAAAARRMLARLALPVKPLPRAG
jgi:uncharacterized protein